MTVLLTLCVCIWSFCLFNICTIAHLIIAVGLSFKEEEREKVSETTRTRERISQKLLIIKKLFAQLSRNERKNLLGSLVLPDCWSHHNISSSVRVMVWSLEHWSKSRILPDPLFGLCSSFSISLTVDHRDLRFCFGEGDSHDINICCESSAQLCHCWLLTNLFSSLEKFQQIKGLYNFCFYLHFMWVTVE